MRHIRGYLESINTTSTIINITGDLYNHLKNVLRLKISDRVTLFNNIDGCDYKVIISNINKNTIECKIVDKIIINNENYFNIHLYQSLIKNDNFDLVIQKATEMGVNEITPIITERTNLKIKHSTVDKKVSRWQKIAINSSEQCGRVFFPKINNPISISNAVDTLDKNSLKILLSPYSDKQVVIENIQNNNDFDIFIGPEGGFTDKEVESLENINTVSVNLGKRILRSETSHINIVSIINFLKN